MMSLMVIRDKDTREGNIDCVLAFANGLDRLEAEELMYMHRYDTDMSDMENMFEALNESGIEYEIFDDVYEMWY